MAALNFYICTEADKKSLDTFFSCYYIEREVFCPAVRPANKPKNSRVCRYCGAAGPGKWKKDAHAIPHFMGNNTLFAADECSECNEKFSNSENNLADFLGIARPINQVKGKSGIPKFKSIDKKVRSPAMRSGTVSSISKSSDQRMEKVTSGLMKKTVFVK